MGEAVSAGKAEIERLVIHSDEEVKSRGRIRAVEKRRCCASE